MKRYSCTNGNGTGLRKRRRGWEVNDEGGGGGILLSAF